MNSFIFSRRLCVRLLRTSLWRLSLLCFWLPLPGFFPVNQGLRIRLVWDTGAVVACGPQPHADRTGALVIPGWRRVPVIKRSVVSERSGDVSSGDVSFV